MKIYTKTGDEGKTSFFGGERVSKNDMRIEAYGTVDELNSLLGVVFTFTGDKFVKEILSKIQNDLFTVCAELASLTFKGKNPMPKVGGEQSEELEMYIDQIEAQLAPQTSFIIPGGTQAGAFLHFARTVARRAERIIVALGEKMEINPELIKYMNRVSDLLYVLARLVNKELAVKEQQPIYKYLKES